MGTARVFQLAEVLLEGEGQRNRADSRYGHGGRRHDASPWRARAEENGRGWSLTKSTSSEECGRSVRRRPWSFCRATARVKVQWMRASRAFRLLSQAATSVAIL